MRRDVLLIVVIAAAAFAVRVYPPWDSVFGAGGVSFLETDAAYHVRLIENQVRNYPWRVTLDPYAAPAGQFVPIAPLLDTLTSTVVVVLDGRAATTAEVEVTAAFVPPVLGALTVVAVWALARRLFDRRAGLIAAVLLAILPGHFMDRTLLGFVDHHALEALLAVATLLALATPRRRSGLVPVRGGSGLIAGVALGLYLLSWGSGAFFVAILGAWLSLFALVARDGEDLPAAAHTTGIAAVVALALVLLFQEARMYRYESQIIGLAALVAIAGVARLTAGREVARGYRRIVLASVAIAVVAAALVVWLVARPVVLEVFADMMRLAPDATRMAVLEARPLFLYSGEWRWLQPWTFFRTGIVIGALALVPFAVRVWRERRSGDALLLVFTIATLVATIGQNRFGYYLVTACAVLGGWLATVVLDWGGVPHAENPTPVPHTRLPLARELAVIVVAGGMIAPNLSPHVLLAERATGFPPYWRDTMTWLREQTPPPFLRAAGRGEDYYYARYPEHAVPAPDYTVLNWWDHGYWITQQARRVPVSNPTQMRAANAARFYVETEPPKALGILAEEGSRYVLSDWELPFRRLASGTIMGRFQNVVDWAGGEHARYYEVMYRREGAAWMPVWVFHEPYYRSMAFRLSVLGGMAAIPANATAVITSASRVDNNGVRFREMLTQHTYATYDAARQAAAEYQDAIIAGLDPWQPAFPLEALDGLTQVYAARTPQQQPSEAPWVRVFQVQQQQVQQVR